MGMQSVRRQRWLMALFAFIVSAVATVLASTATPASSSSPTAPTQSASGSPSSTTPTTQQDGKKLRIGIAYGDTLTWKNDQDLAVGLDDAVHTGATWVRVDLSWNNIQPDSPTHYAWQRFDRIVTAARARNLEVLATIGYTPGWARKAGCTDDPSCAPSDPNAFAGFAKLAAQRYAPMGIHTWEIWNEPNLPFWAPKPAPDAYTQLLQAASKALRNADPKAYLMMGGLAAVTTDPQTGYMSQNEFLTAVCKLGANKLVDAISYHPYTYPYLPSAKTGFGTAMEQISSTKDNLVGVLQQYGTPDLPVWLTETGAATNGPGVASDGKTIPPNTTHVTEDFQAAIATDTIPAAAANPHVAAVFWFADEDSGTDKDKQHRSMFYGLRHFDGTPKPALDAYRKAIAAYAQQKQ